MTLINALLSEASISQMTDSGYYDSVVHSQQHNRVAGAHLNVFDGGTIISDTTQRHTASGISWKFMPTDIKRDSIYPLRLSVAKIACVANAPVTVKLWTYRDNANIHGRLFLQGGQIAGIPVDVYVQCSPALTTWEESGALTFTPTETGVVEVMFHVYDGVGIANNFWIDDLSIS